MPVSWQIGDTLSFAISTFKLMIVQRLPRLRLSLLQPSRPLEYAPHVRRQVRRRLGNQLQQAIVQLFHRC